MGNMTNGIQHPQIVDAVIVTSSDSIKIMILMHLTNIMEKKNQDAGLEVLLNEEDS